MRGQSVAVTGAFGYTGKYIARRLLDSGKNVITLTNHPNRPNPFGHQIGAYPFNFEHPDKLSVSLKDIDTLYNTYWIRFPHSGQTFSQAIKNTETLLQSAQLAGIRRIVHISITNPSEHSTYPYFQGKALLETEIKDSGLSYAILRPTVIFGKEDILINNIAYLLRKFKIFPIPGTGEYNLQPIFVDDFAEIAVKVGDLHENLIMDVVGPEVFTFKNLIQLLINTIGHRVWLINLAPEFSLLLSKIVSVLLQDVLLSRGELYGLMDNLLVSKDKPLGKTPLSKWVKENADQIGQRYASELVRHYQYYKE